MKFRSIIIFVFGLIITYGVFNGSFVPMPYRLYEVIPIISYLILFEFVIYIIPQRVKNNGIVLCAMLLPGVWSLLAITQLAKFYQQLPQSPYSSWDIALTYLAVIYVVILYVYSFAVAIVGTRKIKN